MQDESIRIVLASASPRRRELLQAAHVSFVVKAVDVDEDGVAAPSPEGLVMARARLKAEATAALPDVVSAPGLVVGADTVIVLDGEVLGKPKDPEDARRMLTRLSGRVHRVLTGLAVVPVGRDKPPTPDWTAGPPPRDEAWDGTALTAFAVTTVEMSVLTEEVIACYVATGEPLDKAGAYGIQGRGGLLVERLVGDYFNVVGLPLALLRSMCAAFGVELLQR